MAKFSIDRIEGAYAVLIDDQGNDSSVLLSDLPKGVKEGNVVRYEDGVYALDAAEEQQRRSRILSLQEKLRNKKK